MLRGLADQHRHKRYDEEAGINVSHKIRLAIGVVREDGLIASVSNRTGPYFITKAATYTRKEIAGRPEEDGHGKQQQSYDPAPSRPPGCLASRAREAGWSFGHSAVSTNGNEARCYRSRDRRFESRHGTVCFFLTMLLWWMLLLNGVGEDTISARVIQNCDFHGQGGSKAQGRRLQRLNVSVVSRSSGAFGACRGHPDKPQFPYRAPHKLSVA